MDEEFVPSCDRCGRQEHALTVPGAYLCYDCANEYYNNQVEEDLGADEEENLAMVG